MATGGSSNIENTSVLLSRYIGKNFTGTKEATDNRRQVTLVQESIYNCRDSSRHVFYGGSESEGIHMSDDTDTLYIDNEVVVIYPGQRTPPESTHKTVLYMGKALEAHCYPGYVTLQLGQLGQKHNPVLMASLKNVGEDMFVSSKIFKEQLIKYERDSASSACSEPDSAYKTGSFSRDIIVGFACKHWPTDANEWVTRTRFYGWPPQKVINDIMQNGCHLIPLQESRRPDDMLPWKICMISAERSLLHALSHIQLKVYCLLKYFFIQLTNTKMLEGVTCSIVNNSVLKMLMFFSVENSHPILWQEPNLFYCFWFCFNIFITWAKNGKYPSFFILSEEIMPDIRGEDHQRFLDILTLFHTKKLQSLSHERFLKPDILESISDSKVQGELMRSNDENELEYNTDMGLFVTLATQKEDHVVNLNSTLAKALSLLEKSEAEVDEVITFSSVTRLLSRTVQREGNQAITARTSSNKARYKSLKKCKHHLTLSSSAYTSDLCYLATFYFLSGSYDKSLKLCRHIVSQPLFHMKSQMLLPPEQKARYVKEYCGKGYSLYHKMKTSFGESLFFEKDSLYLPQLRPEIIKSPVGVRVPPLPYAVFLSFLCCQELGDTTGRDTELRNMIVVKYSSFDGGDTCWTVHTLLGICYETLGDLQRAIRCYTDSEESKTELHQYNPALDRIESLKTSEAT
ncbi:uncharacterized protein [Argopecten irradians]|uniref:uncharacterized protein n=1 Tax=Argopecten irradians TaxID=31199 RepID=UPI003720DCC7